MAEVLRVNDTSPGHLAPVLDAVLEKAIRLWGSSFGTLSTYDGHVSARGRVAGGTQEQEALLVDRPPAAGEPTGQIANGEDIVHLLDARIRTDIGTGSVPRAFTVDGVRCPDGDVGYYTQRPRISWNSDHLPQRGESIHRQGKIELVRSFAARAVIGRANARLINRRRRLWSHEKLQPLKCYG